MSIFFAAKQKVSAQGQSSAAKNIFSVAKTIFFVAKAQVIILKKHFNGPLPRLDDLRRVSSSADCFLMPPPGKDLCVRSQR